MDGKGFQVWLSAARRLTRAQRREALAALSGRSDGEASKAAIELGVDEARRCPHCASEGAVSRGMARGLRRYQCKDCGRTFNALTGTPLSGLHHKKRWLSFGASLAKGETVKASAARCDVAVSTAFRWRHRFLAAARSDSEVLKGIVEADETYVLESRKGARGLGRKARRRGGKAKKRGLSREQVPVLMAADRSGTTVSAALPRVRCGGAHGCPRSGGCEGRPAGLRRWRELPTLCRRARGEPRSTQPLDGGTGSGRSACADGEQPPQPVEGLPTSPPRHRHPLFAASASGPQAGPLQGDHRLPLHAGMLPLVLRTPVSQCARRCCLGGPPDPAAAFNQRQVCAQILVPSRHALDDSAWRSVLSATLSAFITTPVLMPMVRPSRAERTL